MEDELPLMTENNLNNVQLETRQQLQVALNEVLKWEKEQNRLAIWERMSRLPFKLLDKLTPKIIHQKIGQLLDELGNYIQNGGNYLVAGGKVKRMLAKASQASGGSEEPPYPLAVMDAVTKQLSESARKVATAQGATIGIGGIFTLAADIPAMLGLSLKAIQEIGLGYGFNPEEKNERIFTVKVMQFALSDIVGKKAVLEELSLQTDGRGDLSQGAYVDAAISKIQGWKEVMTVYRDSWGWKKLFQMVPIAGMLFGARSNRKSIGDVAEAAHMLYRKRVILQRLAALAGRKL